MNVFADYNVVYIIDFSSDVFNSLAAGKFEWYLDCVIFKLILVLMVESFLVK